MARFFRVSNSNKLAITSNTRCLVHLLARDEVDQAALTWHDLTAAGEEWRSHPDYLAATHSDTAPSRPVVDRQTILARGEALPTEAGQLTYTERDLYVSEATA